MELICLHCNKQFITENKNKKYCKSSCVRMAWARRNKDKVKVISRRSNIKNKEKIDIRIKEWREKNKDKVLSYARKSYKKHSERKKKYIEEWQELNLDKVKSYRIKWRKNNRNKIKFNSAMRRAKLKNATPSWANLDKIKEIYLNCPKGYHVDHIIPLCGKTVTGLHVENNLQYLKAEENIKKGNKLINL